MASLLSAIHWISANWVQITVSLLAIDVALIPVFPEVQLLVKIKNVLMGVVPAPKA